MDSIRANTCQYTKYGFVWNGYYPLMKYSIRILRERQGWLLSSQKAVWLLTIRYFWWLPLDFHLDRGWRLEYRICWSVTPLTMFPCSMEVIPACNVVTFNWTDIQFIEKILVFSAIYRGACIGNREGWLLEYGYLTCICLNRKKRCLHGIVAGSE